MSADSEKTTDALVGSPGWIERAQACVDADGHSPMSDYLDDALFEIGRLRAVLATIGGCTHD